MLPTPVRDTTTLPRVMVAILFAFVFPPIALALASIASDSGDGLERASFAVAAIPRALMMSLLGGWIFVLPACLAWAVLQALNRHYWPAATLVGLATGIAFASLLQTFDDVHSEAMELFVISATFGALTGLGVWWLAYGRQEALPQPIVTLPPLNL
uniref:Uncharacterized protein n=1 Tax=Caulobacter sp. (strain K31) TaxID=366602 RepID=B0T7Z7_CAUSK